MSLKEQLQSDLKEAMKEKDRVRKDSITLIRSAILQIEKDKKIILDDDGIAEVLSKELKSRKEALLEIEKSGRDNLLADARREVEIVQSYMPQQLSEAEVEVLVREAIQESGAQSAKEMGKVMKAVLPKVKGKADGNLVNSLVKKLLG